MDAASLFPDLWVTTITAEAIHDGCNEFMRRAREAATPEEDGAVDFEDVEVTQKLTCEQLGQIPEDWLRRVRVKWHPEGTLAITKVETRQHGEARMELFSQLHEYARHDYNLRDERGSRLLLPNGTIVTPDIVITRLFNTSTPVPLLVCEVDVAPRSVAHMVRKAAAYLTQYSHISRVMWLQFFPPRTEELADQTQRLRFPALAVIFCQSTTDPDCVQVIQMVSFGNAPVSMSFLKAFAEPQDDVLCVPFANALNLATETSPYLPTYFDASTMLDDLYELRRTPAPKVWDVAMEAPLPTFRVDLKRVCLEALLGWQRDQHHDNWDW